MDGNFTEQNFTREDIEVMSAEEIALWFDKLQYEEMTKKKREILLNKVSGIVTPSIKLN